AANAANTMLFRINITHLSWLFSRAAAVHIRAARTTDRWSQGMDTVNKGAVPQKLCRNAATSDEHRHLVAVFADAADKAARRRARAARLTAKARARNVERERWLVRKSAPRHCSSPPGAQCTRAKSGRGCERDMDRAHQARWSARCRRCVRARRSCSPRAAVGHARGVSARTLLPFRGRRDLR